MQVVFHEAFHTSRYSDDAYDNAADPGRLEVVMAALRDEGGFPVVEPAPATRADLLRGHSEAHVASIEARPGLFGIASLAVGAAIRAAELAMKGQTAFACVRPPGHHARRDSAWGHCTFSNVALSLLHLRDTGLIKSAYVVDFDQHTGDGTVDILRGWAGAQVFNPHGDSAAEYLQVLEEGLMEAREADVVAVSAGFDGALEDLGRKLSTEDYFTIGRLLQGHSIRLRHQRRFAVLEGGYYLPALGRNVLSFCRGFE